MCFRGSTNLKTVLGTLENTLKIKSMVTALLYTQMDQDMKVKCAHKTDFCVVELWFGDWTCLDAGLYERASRSPDQSVTQQTQAHRVDTETRKPCNERIGPCGESECPCSQRSL